jgi:glycosyltransferase involved in cell wall biosynthesis
MLLALIARADNRGLGQQTWAVHRNLRPAKTLVVNCHSAQPLKLRLERFPNALVVDGLPSQDDFRELLHGVTCLYTAETGYSPELWDEAEQRGIRTVLHANYEFLDERDRPTVWAAPSLWNFDRWPAGTVHLPVPIETDRFPITDKPSTARRFLHVVGRPAIHDRNGTLDLLLALRHVKSTISVTVTCQHPGYVGGLINDHSIHTPGNVTLTVEPGDTENYWDNYTGYDALILPRRFGGLCLPANEAIGAGMPVIMPDTNPNDTWLPPEWLVRSTHAGEFRAKQHITYVRTDPQVLAEKIDQLAQDPEFYGLAVTKALTLRDKYSWETLTPMYEQVLS